MGEKNDWPGSVKKKKYGKGDSKIRKREVNYLLKTEHVDVLRPRKCRNSGVKLST